MDFAHPRRLFSFLDPLYDAVSPFFDPLVRLAVAGPLLVHGAQKLMAGPQPVIDSMQRIGASPAAPIAYLIMFLETVGAFCVIIGFLTRPFAIALFIESLVIILAVQMPKGFIASRGGYEMVLCWAIVFLALALRGGGRYSVDRAIGFEL